MNEYVKWSNEEEQVTHIGVLTKETETHVFILTKYGEMEIPKEDGEFSESTREEFEQVVVEKPVVEQVVTSSRSGSKMEKAVQLYKENPGMKRCDMIRLIMDQLDMSKQGASTYYQTIFSKNK